VWSLCVIALITFTAGLITAGEPRQRTTQLLACVEHPRLHRVDRALHDRRDLLAGVAHQVRELHHHALLERQLCECLPEPLTVLVLQLRVRRNCDRPRHEHRSGRTVPTQRFNARRYVMPTIQVETSESPRKSPAFNHTVHKVSLITSSMRS
jgi:hypothetical protein